MLGTESRSRLAQLVPLVDVIQIMVAAFLDQVLEGITKDEQLCGYLDILHVFEFTFCMFNTYHKTENKNNSLIINICKKHIKAKICKI